MLIGSQLHLKKTAWTDLIGNTQASGTWLRETEGLSRGRRYCFRELEGIGLANGASGRSS